MSSSGSKQKAEPLPTISVVAKVSDLKAYRSGQINASQLDTRISVATVKEDDSQQLDMEVMANIFETAFKDSEERSFRIRGSVNHLNLDNFGALFFFDARYSNFSNAIFSISGSNSLKRAQELRLKSIREEREKEEADEQKLKQEQLDAFEAFKTNLKEYLVDYGRTLKSVDSDQFILVSVNLSSPLDEIPERIDVQIKKSILESIDRGSVSRDQALNQVSVREY